MSAEDALVWRRRSFAKPKAHCFGADAPLVYDDGVQWLSAFCGHRLPADASEIVGVPYTDFCVTCFVRSGGDDPTGILKTIAGSTKPEGDANG